MRTLLTKALVCGSIAAAGLALAATAAGATNISQLSAACYPSHNTVTVNPLVTFDHRIGAGYWAHVDMECSVPRKMTIEIRKDYVTVQTYTATWGGSVTIPALTEWNGKTPAFFPVKGAKYQIVVRVWESNGVYLGYAKSYVPQVLVA